MPALPASRPVRLGLLLCAALVLGFLGYQLHACLDAGVVIDDEWGIRVHGDGPLLGVLAAEFTGPTYASADHGSVDQYAWGPLAAGAQDLVAAVFGRGSMAPFRVLNVLLFGATLAAVGTSIARLTRSAPITVLGVTALCVHPVAAECVPWASGVFDVLAAMILAVGVAVSVSRARPTAAGEAVIAGATTLLACLAKPTALPVALVLPILAWLTGRPRPVVAASGLAVFLAGVVHQVAYHQATHSQVLANVLRALLLGVNGTRTALWVSYGLSLLDGVRPLLPPAVIRLVSVELDGGRALTGYAALALALIGLAPLARTRFGRIAGAALLVWLAGLLPGALFSVFRFNHGIRYSFLPLVGVLPLVAWAALEGGRALGDRVDSGLIRTLGAVTLAGVLGGWTWWSGTRVADYRDNVTFFTAERADPDFADDPVAGPVLDVLLTSSTFREAVRAARHGEPGADPCRAGTAYGQAALSMTPNFILDQQAEFGAFLKAVRLGHAQLAPPACSADALTAFVPVFDAIKSRKLAAEQAPP